MKLRPLGDKIVIKQMEAEEKTKSGIVLPTQSQEKPQQAEVIAVGPGGMVYGEDSFKVLEKINKRKTYAEKPKKEIMITSVTLEPVEQPGFESTFEFPQPNFIRKEADTSKTSGKAN